MLNAVAAMPSLHAGLSLLAALWFTRNAQRWIRVASLLYPLAMTIALVYFGEHYVIDCIFGFAVVLTAWKIADWWESRRDTSSSLDQLTN